MVGVTGSVSGEYRLRRREQKRMDMTGWDGWEHKRMWQSKMKKRMDMTGWNGWEHKWVWQSKMKEKDPNLQNHPP